MVGGGKDTKKVLMFWQGKTLLYECGGHCSPSHPLSTLSWKFGLAVSTLTFPCLFSSDSCCTTQFKGYSLVAFGKGQYPIVTVIAYCMSVLFHLSLSSYQLLCSWICGMCGGLVSVYLFLWVGRYRKALSAVALFITAQPESLTELSFRKQSESNSRPP